METWRISPKHTAEHWRKLEKSKAERWSEAIKIARDRLQGQGRLAATRWLIEIVGIKQGKDGNPAHCKKDPKYADDVHIEDFDGGAPPNH